MSDPFVPIVAAAADLKRQVPEQYGRLLVSLSGWAERAKEDLVAASEKGIFGAQGKAQTLAELVKKLSNCIELDEQYRTRK